MDRYDQTHIHNGVKFYLKDYTPNLDECRFLILKVIEQTIRDYVMLYESTVSSEMYAWTTAVGFLFDDKYTISWGGTDFTLQDLAGFVDIDVEYLRERVDKQFENKYGEK